MTQTPVTSVVICSPDSNVKRTYGLLLRGLDHKNGSLRYLYPALNTFHSAVSTTFFPALSRSSALEANFSGKIPQLCHKSTLRLFAHVLLLLLAYCPHLLLMLLFRCQVTPQVSLRLCSLRSLPTTLRSAQSLAMKHMFCVPMFMVTFTGLPSGSPHTPHIPVFGY